MKCEGLPSYFLNEHFSVPRFRRLGGAFQNSLYLVVLCHFLLSLTYYFNGKTHNSHSLGIINTLYKTDRPKGSSTYLRGVEQDVARTSPGQDVTRTRRHPDKTSPGQDVTRTRRHPDKTSPGQDVTRTRRHPDKTSPRQDVPRRNYLKCRSFGITDLQEIY